MRVLRLAALYGSLILLVATAVSVVHRRGDIRDDQSRRAEQTATLAASSVRASVEQLRKDVHLAAAVADRGASEDDRELASDLTAVVADAEVCVGDSAAGCTGADLYSSPIVGELASESARLVDSGDDAVMIRALVTVDSATDSVYIVRRIAAGNDVTTVAMRVPVENLVSKSVRTEIVSAEATLAVDADRRTVDDGRSDVTTANGRRTTSETIGSPFVEGSITIESGVEGAVGIAGDRTARYSLLLGAGTVLLALAGWTFFAERRQLERRATTDELTGLVNRREFERVSEEALDAADRFNTGLCLMVVDLNGFKQVNDTLGHQFGDRVLAASSQRLVAAVRDTDVVGRWGGDEFVILLPGLADRGAVRKSAERIWNSLASSPVVGDTSMTGSIGAAIFPRHGTSIDALMRSADVAMYAAKTTGVSHRIADTIAASESTLGDESGAGGSPIITDQYVGPDRRHIAGEADVDDREALTNGVLTQTTATPAADIVADRVVEPDRASGSEPASEDEFAPPAGAQFGDRSPIG